MGGKQSKGKKDVKKETKKDVKKDVKKEDQKQDGAEEKARVLVVYANPEPKSFCNAMKQTIVETLTKNGHEVQVSDLYAMRWFDPLDKGDFTKLEDPDYFKPQAEQGAANARNFLTFSPAVKGEHEKVKWCDIMIFVFPVYWWGFPGILKSWFDRVFSMKFAYGLQGDASLADRKAMVVYSTGSPKEAMVDNGMEHALWKMIHHGIFQFCSLTSLQPFVAYKSPWVSDAERKQYLADIAAIMAKIDDRAELELPEH